MSFRAKLAIRYPPNAPLHRVRYRHSVDGSVEEVSTSLALSRVITTEKAFTKSYSFVADVPRDGLVAEWLLFEGSGNAIYDTSGDAIHCTVSGNYSWVKLPTGKYALALDGSTTQVWCRRSDKATILPNGFTFMAWVKPYNLAGRRWLLAKKGTDFQILLDNAIFWLWVNDGTLPDYFKVSTYPRTVSVNEWRHLAAILDNINQMWYLVVDGSLWASGSTPKKFSFLYSISPFTLLNNYGSSIFNGLLGLARFYSVPLGLDEVMSIYSVEKQLFVGG
jgi:hypothetical protein